MIQSLSQIMLFCARGVYAGEKNQQRLTSVPTDVALGLPLAAPFW